MKRRHSVTCGKTQAFKLQDFCEVEDEQMRVLGNGTYGEVRLVQHKSGDLYALKVIDKHSIVDEDALLMLKREIEVHKNLTHRHIAKLYDHFEDDDNVYLLLEYASKGALFYKARRKQRLTEDEARKFFKQTTEGILHLHLNHIIHRDLKPENILLDSKENVKICDFGWCVKTTEVRNSFCGTLDYMAPEIFSAEGHSFEVDLWALGVLLYELLHGAAPFSAGSEADIGLKILKCQYVIGKHVSEEAASLIRALLVYDPEERLQAADILNHPWVEKWNERPIGGIVSCVVPGYGQVEGIVKEIVGDECIIYHELLDTTSNMNLDDVSELIAHPQRTTSSEFDGYDPREDVTMYRNSYVSRPTKGSFRPPINIFGEFMSEDRSMKGSFNPSLPFLTESSSSDRRNYRSSVDDKRSQLLLGGGDRGERFPEARGFSGFTTEESEKFIASLQSPCAVEDPYAIVARLFDDKLELQEMTEAQRNYFEVLRRGWKGLEVSRVKPLVTAQERPSYRTSALIAKEVLIADEPKPRPSRVASGDPNSKETLRKRKLELEQLTLQIQGSKQAKETKPKVDTSRTQKHDKEEHGGFFSWFGDLIGCTKRN
jgi:serine/threonine protein kinase